MEGDILEIFEIGETDIGFINEAYAAFLEKDWQKIKEMAVKRFSNHPAIKEHYSEDPEWLTMVSLALYFFSMDCELALAFKSMCVAGSINYSIKDCILPIEINNIQNCFINAYWMLYKKDSIHFRLQKEGMIFLNGQTIIERPHSDLDAADLIEKVNGNRAKEILKEMITDFHALDKGLAAVEMVVSLRKERAAN